MSGFSLIKIFCDTNILHTSQAHLLLSKKVSEYILSHHHIESVELKWFLPDMVVQERRHQMIQRALELLPKINELEKLLGHGLGMNEEVMTERVNTKISKCIEEHKLQVCELDYNRVEWSDIVSRSATRKPPFEVAGEKEKGFRDSIIATSFVHELEDSPVTPRSCLLVFISGDGRIREYLTEKTVEYKNVRIFDNLDTLKSLLNAIASEIEEKFLSDLSLKADQVFYDYKKKDGLYSKENVYKKIFSDFSGELFSVIESYDDDCFREEGVIRLGEQTFIKKKGQTVFWKKTLQLDFEIHLSHSGKEISNSRSDKIGSGVSIFHINWKHQISTREKIMKPQVVNIEFVENIIDNLPPVFE